MASFTFDGIDTVVWTGTVVNGVSYTLLCDDISSTVDTQTAVGTTLTLTVDDAGGNPAGFTFRGRVRRNDTGVIIAASGFKFGTAGEYAHYAVWSYDGGSFVSVDIASVLGVDYKLFVFDDAGNSDSSSVVAGTGGIVELSLTAAGAYAGGFMGQVANDSDGSDYSNRVFVQGVASSGVRGNPSSPFGRVCVAFDDGPLVAFPDWVRLDTDGRPSFVVDIEIVAGKQEEFDETETNHATVRFNDREGLLDPNNTGSPWFGKLNGKQIAIQLYNPVDSTWYSRFRGVIDKWGHDLNPATRDGVSILSSVALECVGIFDYLAGFGLTPGLHGDVGGPDGVVFYEDGEVDVRQVSILTDATIDPSRYVVFSGNVDVIEMLYDPDDRALVALRDAADAETPVALANIYEDRFGRYVFHGRQAALDPDTVAAGAGDAAWDFQRFYIGDGAAIAGDANYAQIRPPLQFQLGRDRIVNVALVTPRDVDRAAVAGLVKSDATSIAAYGVHSFSHPDSINGGHKTNGDTAVQDLGRSAQFLVNNYKDPHVRLTAVTLKAMATGDARAAKTWAVLSRADIADAAYLKFGYPEGVGVEGEQSIQGWRQTITPLNTDHDMVELTLNVTPAPTSNPYND